MEQNRKQYYILNYLYMSKNHAGGKDQVGINLLKGFVENGNSDELILICYDYSYDYLRKIAPDVHIITIKAPKSNRELTRLLTLLYHNTFTVYRIAKTLDVGAIFHLSCMNGFRKMPITSIVLPHDIKAVAHRVLANVKVKWYKYLIYKMMYYVDFKHADHIVAISDVDKKDICSYYASFKEKVLRIYNPIIIQNHPTTGIKKNSIVAINLQFHHKNIITLIKAFEKVKDQLDHNGEKCMLYLVGNVPERVHYLKDYVENNQLTDQICFTGFLNEKEKADLLDQCRLYVNPSLYEGFGMTAVESIIMEVPTLISKVTTNYEVTQGLCNYYEPAESVDALADAIVNCMSQETDAKQQSMAADQLKNAYDYRKIAHEYIELFHQSSRMKDRGM